MTEQDGKFLFPALPSGTYTLTFALQGFKEVKRENIVLTLGRTLTVDMQLDVATVEESVTVTGESPLVDRTTTAVGNEFSAEKLALVPSATDLWAALAQSPGVRMLGFDGFQRRTGRFDQAGLLGFHRLVGLTRLFDLDGMLGFDGIEGLPGSFHRHLLGLDFGRDGFGFDQRFGLLIQAGFFRAEFGETRVQALQTASSILDGLTQTGARRPI